VVFDDTAFIIVTAMLSTFHHTYANHFAVWFQVPHIPVQSCQTEQLLYSVKIILLLAIACKPSHISCHSKYSTVYSILIMGLNPNCPQEWANGVNVGLMEKLHMVSALVAACDLSVSKC
jgi:hypothetical protein